MNQKPPRANPDPRSSEETLDGYAREQRMRAAAPAMYKALRNLEQAATAERNAIAWDSETRMQWLDACDKAREEARAAIAQADGTEGR